jgi:organic hydroperoxide reductase OsmC/OhrA
LTREHHYRITTTWTGNLGTGTSDYRAYSRDHEIKISGKRTPLPGSSDRAFRGDPARYTPEELLVASLSTCHMLWFLHLCADAGIVVTEYEDVASGAMSEHVVPDPDAGSGEFTRVVLRPRAAITDAARIDDALALHSRAHELCFIARSVNFPVEHEPVVVGA